MLNLLTKFYSVGARGTLLRQCRLFTSATTEHPTQAATIESPEPTQTQTTDAAVDSDNDTLYKRLELEMRSMDKAVMESFVTFAATAAQHLGIELGRCWSPRKHELERYTLLRSAFSHKKHRVQYEIRTYYKFMHLHRLTGSTLSTYLEYIQRNLPEGVAMKTTKIEITELEEHLRQPPAPQTTQNENTQ